MTFLMPWLRSKLGFHLLRVLVMPLDGLPPVKVKHPNLRYAALMEAEALEWSRDPELELNPERVSAAFRRGDFCVGVSEQGRPVGYIWFAFEPAPHIGRLGVFRPPLPLLYKSFIRPSHRGRRISGLTPANEICQRRRDSLGILTRPRQPGILEALRRVGHPSATQTLSLSGGCWHSNAGRGSSASLGGERGTRTHRAAGPSSPETLRN
jgi:hypothetical protein